MARVVAQEVRDPRDEVAAVVLTDPTPPGDLGFPVRSAHASRIRFCAAVGAAAIRRTHFIYDFVGTARAHALWPSRLRPFLTFIHGIEIWDERRNDRVRCARRAALLLANSHYTLERASALHGQLGKTEVCWLATEADAPPPTLRRDEGPPEVLFCGRVADAYKGHLALIESWPRVLQAVPEARLTIAGAGSEKLAPLVAAQGCGERIALRGFVSEPEMEQLFASATAFAMPSRGEGFGLVYVEAMRHGLPVIASVHDAAPEINLDGQTGYNVNLDQPGELADRIVQLLGDRDHARRLGEAARQRWAEHFRFSAFRRRFAPLLRRFLQS